MNYKHFLICGSLSVSLLACGGGQAPDEASTQADSEQSASGSVSLAPRTAAPQGSKVFFITPTDGTTVSSPILVQFGIEEIAIAPAGTYQPATGHHHLLIDTGPPAMDMPIPGDDNHRHFGSGQAETTVELPPGQHTLRLLVADGNHVPHEPPVMSEEITITVE